MADRAAARLADMSDLVERRRLYDAGHSDNEIAEATATKANTITVWRRKAGLPNVGPGGPVMPPEQNARRMVLYSLRWSDHHIAREEGVNKRSIRYWRIERGLAPNFPVGVRESYRPRPTLGDLMRRIRRAVGYGLARDVAEDVVGDLYVAILSGAIPLERVEAEARKFGNRVLDRFASKFGPRSLDKEIGDSDGFTLLDTMKDESSSDWLEEMGATVW